MAFPDMEITVEDQLAQDDLVATRWTSRGTQTGALMGIEPTGKQVTVSGVTISRLVDGKLRRSSTVGTCLVSCSRTTRSRRLRWP